MIFRTEDSNSNLSWAEPKDNDDESDDVIVVSE